LPGKILDCGCATGLFLEEARARGGGTSLALKISEYSARIAGHSLGPSIKIGAVDKIDFANGIFDCVTMFDLIEHISRAVPAFAKGLTGWLKPGGSWLSLPSIQ